MNQQKEQIPNSLSEACQDIVQITGAMNMAYKKLVGEIKFLTDKVQELEKIVEKGKKNEEN